MKTDIHPTYFDQAKVVCACGNTFTTGSTKPEIHVEICSKCHPYYTGSAKFIDTEGRVERFQRQEKEAKTTTEKLEKRKEEKREKEEKPRPTSLKGMMELIRKQS
jgi:large subunit ribosomal protein L31